MKKKIGFLILFLLLFNMFGCASKTSKDGIYAPEPTKIEVEGRWEVTKEFDNKNQSQSLLGEKIGISTQQFVLRGILYEEANYKLKYVDINEYMKFQYKINLLDYGIEINEKTDVITLYRKSKLICEIIRLDDDSNKAYLIYNEGLYELTKIDNETSRISEYVDNSKSSPEVEFGEMYNKPTGVLIGLKSKAKQNDQNEYEPINYYTVWINFDNGEIKYIDTKKNLLIPRSKNFWKLSVDRYFKDNAMYEMINTAPVGGSEEKEDKEWLPQANRDYSEIEFVGNDYLGVKHSYEIEDGELISRYGIRTLESPNLSEQLTVEELYGAEGKKQFDMSEKLAKGDNDEASLVSDYTKLMMEREMGKWVLKGYWISDEADNNSISKFYLKSLPTSKLINYDKLQYPWSKIIKINRHTKDLITSPNRRYAIALMDGYLNIYEIRNGEIDTEPMKRYNIGDADELIMAEWASGDFVANWDKAFREFK